MDYTKANVDDGRMARPVPPVVVSQHRRDRRPYC